MKHLMAALVLMGALCTAGVLYPQTLVVDTAVRIETGEYEVSMHSNAGFTYTAKTAMEDLIPGDVMSAIMYNSNTPEDVRDDTILYLRYSGFFATDFATDFEEEENHD